MKRLTAIFLLTTGALCISLSCSEDGEKGPQIGCMTGLPKSGGTDRELIRCCTKEQALAGDNVAAGGIARAKNYKNISWTPVNDCSECY